MGKDVTIGVPDAARADGSPGKQSPDMPPPMRCPKCGSTGPHGATWRQDIYQLWFFCGNCGMYLKPLRG